MGFNDICNTGLVLGLGIESTVDTSPTKTDDDHRVKKLSFEPSLTLGLSKGGDFEVIVKKNYSNYEFAGDLYRQDSTTASSLSNASVKREREIGGGGAGGGEEAAMERVSSRVSTDEDDDGMNPRKKLRLTKDQSAMLEESFKLHSTLNPKQKQDLARELNLRPRQVEVWFQNRRARTKLKQTEVDCEFLKKCCETLTDENRRLQKELQELKALKLAQSFYMQLPAATLTMCPSCEKIGATVNAGDKTSKNPLTMAPKPHFYNPFTNSSSAAC